MQKKDASAFKKATKANQVAPAPAASSQAAGGNAPSASMAVKVDPVTGNASTTAVVKPGGAGAGAGSSTLAVPGSSPTNAAAGNHHTTIEMTVAEVSVTDLETITTPRPGTAQPQPAAQQQNQQSAQPASTSASAATNPADAKRSDQKALVPASSAASDGAVVTTHERHTDMLVASLRITEDGDAVEQLTIAAEIFANQARGKKKTSAATHILTGTPYERGQVQDLVIRGQLLSHCYEQLQIALGCVVRCGVHDCGLHPASDGQHALDLRTALRLHLCSRALSWIVRGCLTDRLCCCRAGGICSLRTLRCASSWWPATSAPICTSTPSHSSSGTLRSTPTLRMELSEHLIVCVLRATRWGFPCCGENSIWARLIPTVQWTNPIADQIQRALTQAPANGSTS